MIGRAPIEQAKGMVMYARGVDGDEAFGQLVRQSQRENRKMQAIVADVIAGVLDARFVGDIPEGARRG